MEGGGKGSRRDEKGKKGGHTMTVTEFLARIYCNTHLPQIWERPIRASRLQVSHQVHQDPSKSNGGNVVNILAKGSKFP